MSHARDFGTESDNPEAAQKLVYDYRECNLSVADQALCQYALRLTLRANVMSEQDVQTLREHNFDDHQITIAAQVIGYFNYINRIANGLEVRLESWMTEDYQQWLTSKPDWDSLLN